MVEIGDGRLVHLRDEGPRDAPVIVLLHGSNADLHTWQPWVDALSDDYRVIRFDQRGHGLTGPAGDGDYTLTAFGADIDAVTAALGVERFVLAGNSMGGAIAMGYAIANPEGSTGSSWSMRAARRSSARPKATSRSGWPRCPAWAR